MSKFWFLVSYSLKKRVKTKAFLIACIIEFLLILLVCNIPTIIAAVGGDFQDEKIVYVFDETDNSHAYTYLSTNNTDETIKYELKGTYDETLKDEYLTTCKYYLVIKNNVDVTFVGESLDLTDSMNLTTTLNKMKESLYLETASDEIKGEIETYLKDVTITYDYNTNESSNTLRSIVGALSVFIMMPVFFLIILLMTMVGADIIEEKSSRSIEIIISNVKPTTHFGAKILSAVLFLLIQGALLIIFMLIGGGSLLLTASTTGLFGDISGISDITTSTASALEIDPESFNQIISKIPLLLVFLVLFAVGGILFYIVAIAVCAALSTNNEDYQQAQSPLMLFLLAGFYLGIFGIQFQGSGFVEAMAFVPFFAPFLAPALYICGDLALWQVLISLVILIIFDVVVIKVGIPLYRSSILSFSNDKFFKKIKNAFKSMKDTE